MDLLRRSDNKHVLVSNSERLREDLRSDAVDALNGQQIPIGKYVEKYVAINDAVKKKTIHGVQSSLIKILG